MPSAKQERATTSYLLARIFHTLRATRIEPVLRPHGVTSLHYTLLTVVLGNERYSSAQLARRFHVTPQTMGQLLSVLEQKDLVARSGDAENRRILRVHITAAGRKLVRQCRRHIDQIEDEVFGRADDPSVKAFRAKLYEVADRLRDADHP